MEKEVKELEAQVAKLEKETAELVMKKEKKENGHSLPAAQSQTQNFKVSYKMNIVPEEGSYILILDSQLPMASVIMQSKQNIDILDIKDNTASINRI